MTVFDVSTYNNVLNDFMNGTVIQQMVTWFDCALLDSSYNFDATETTPTVSTGHELSGGAYHRPPGFQFSQVTQAGSEWDVQLPSPTISFSAFTTTTGWRYMLIIRRDNNKPYFLLDSGLINIQILAKAVNVQNGSDPFLRIISS